MGAAEDRPDRRAENRPRTGSARSAGARGPRTGDISRAGGARSDRSAPRPDRSDRSERLRRDQDRRPRRVEPPLPDDVTGDELDRAVRAELSSLAKLNAEAVARHLVMAGRLLDEDPETAYAHAVAARERAGRVGAVREAAGLAAYRSGRYAEALADLRAARRISGDQSLLPVMADCERGLGRPERALAVAASPEARTLPAAVRAELLIVASGARRDLGQPEAAAVMLQGPELRPERRKPWSARLFYAYSEALRACGREAEALEWLAHAAEADDREETDAAERLAELGGVTFLDAADDA